MRKETIKIREQLVSELWDKKKNSLSMMDVAEIFGISVGNVYRILLKMNKEYGKRKNN